jgi:hypothetical protein
MIKLKASCHPAHLWTEVIGPRGAIGRSRHLQPGARLADAEKRWRSTRTGVPCVK